MWLYDNLTSYYRINFVNRVTAENVNLYSINTYWYYMVIISVQTFNTINKHMAWENLTDFKLFKSYIIIYYVNIFVCEEVDKEYTYKCESPLKFKLYEKLKFIFCS